MLEVETIMRLSKLPRDVIEALLRGITKEDLEILLCGESGTVRADILRMNCSGGLRSLGYVIPRTRGVYQVVDFVAKGESTPASQWTGKKREILDWVESLEQVTTDHQDRLRDHLSQRPYSYVAHENTPGYVLSYELARDRGFWHQTPEGSCLIIWKFQSQPRLRIFQLDLPCESLLGLAQKLSDASLQAVSILNVTEDEGRHLRSLQKGGFISTRLEAIYSTRDISQSPEMFLGKKALRQVRMNQKDTRLISGETSSEDQRFVLDTWKATQEHKHRQLAIGRDYRAVGLGLDLSYLLMRENTPVGFAIYDRLPNRPDIVSDLAHKALNYSTQPNGRSGTNDFLMVVVCQDLFEKGINWINGGSYAGANQGLVDFKKKWADHDFNSRSFVSSFDHLRREDVTI